jgi:hypothetical protein
MYPQNAATAIPFGEYRHSGFEHGKANDNRLSGRPSQHTPQPSHRSNEQCPRRSAENCRPGAKRLERIAKAISNVVQQSQKNGLRNLLPYKTGSR